MQRRSFSREFKVEAVRLVRKRGVSVAQAARDLDLHENVLWKRVQQLADDPLEAFPGSGRMKAAEAEIERADARAKCPLAPERQPLGQCIVLHARKVGTQLGVGLRTDEDRRMSKLLQNSETF